MRMSDEEFIYETICNINPLDSKSKYYAMQDLQVGEMFSLLFGKKIKFNSDLNQWMAYDNQSGKWLVDDSQAKQKAISLVAAIEKYYEEHIKEKITEDKIRKATKNKVTRLMTNKNINSFLLIAKDLPGMVIKNKQLDADPNIINCLNGELHLDDLQLYPHNPQSLCTKCTNVAYVPGATSLLWIKTLNKFFTTDDGIDIETEEYFHKAMGYTIDGKWTLKKFFILYGRSTNNGKSTIMNALVNALGDYAMNNSAKIFCAQKRGSDGPSESLADLNGLRFVAAAEAEQDWPLDCELLKNLTGGDPLRVRRLYGHSFELMNRSKIWIHTNWIPNVTDPTIFDSHRAVIIPIEHKFEPGSKDWNPNIPEELLNKENAEAIFAWIISGLVAFRNDGSQLVETKRISEAIEEQRVESNKTQQFVRECLVQQEGGSVTVTVVYNAYRKWCEKCGYSPYNRTRFRSALKNLNIETVKDKRSGGSNPTTCIKNYIINDSFERKFGIFW